MILVKLPIWYLYVRHYFLNPIVTHGLYLLLLCLSWRSLCWRSLMMISFSWRVSDLGWGWCLGRCKMFNGALMKTLQKKRTWTMLILSCTTTRQVDMLNDFNLVFLLLENEIFGLAISRENWEDEYITHHLSVIKQWRFGEKMFQSFNDLL